MTFYIGTDSVKGVYVGTDEVQKIYVGTNLVYHSSPKKILIFEDNGVTGSHNTNYTSVQGAVATVESNGTKINSPNVYDGYYRANQLIQGDFEVEFTFVEGGNTYYPDVGFINASNDKYWSIDHRTSGDGIYTMETSETIANAPGAITNGEVWKITRAGGTVSFYVNNVLKFTVNNMTQNDLYFAWKTHNHASRWFRFKNLKIYKIEE